MLGVCTLLNSSIGKFLVWLPQRKSNHGLSSSALLSHSSYPKNNWPLVSLRLLAKRAVLLAVLHVSCIAPCSLCSCTPPRVMGDNTSAKSGPNSSLRRSMQCCPKSEIVVRSRSSCKGSWRYVPVIQDARIWSAISSDVLSTKRLQHSIVITLGLALSSCTSTHWLRVGVPSRLGVT